ncbi:MAG: hypothetical protein DSZ02_00565 [Gammaproteobacteria bacterium]|nr:MAG: hypothetical protein DSZ02_00565 [Gammaproteobacteria bacterium]
MLIEIRFKGSQSFSVDHLDLFRLFHFEFQGINKMVQLRHILRMCRDHRTFQLIAVKQPYLF